MWARDLLTTSARVCLWVNELFFFALHARLRARQFPGKTIEEIATKKTKSRLYDKKSVKGLYFVHACLAGLWRCMPLPCLSGCFFFISTKLRGKVSLLGS